MAQLTIAADKAAMSENAAERITSCIEAAIAARALVAVSLTGGGTPDLLYQWLADPNRPWRARIDWTRVHLFWSDEREVPPEHAQSNYGLAHRLLLQHVMVPAAQVHRMHGELPASDAGRLYDAVLRTRRDQTVGPLFDIMLLGIGADGHIASIFPDSPLLFPGSAGPLRPRMAAGVHVPKLSQWRITMTPAAIVDAGAIIVIASGMSKADAVKTAIEGIPDVSRCPAQLLREADAEVEWIIDRAAAARLRGVPPA